MDPIPAFKSSYLLDGALSTSESLLTYQTVICFLRVLHNLYLSEKCEKMLSQSCLTLCDDMDSSLSGSSVHGILQARIVERVTIPFFRGFSLPRD